MHGRVGARSSSRPTTGHRGRDHRWRGARGHDQDVPEGGSSGLADAAEPCLHPYHRRQGEDRWQGGSRVAADLTMGWPARTRSCAGAAGTAPAVPRISDTESELNLLTMCSIEFRFEETEVSTSQVPSGPPERAPLRCEVASCLSCNPSRGSGRRLLARAEDLVLTRGRPGTWAGPDER